MAFTLDTTIGGTEANCYLSLTEADDYFAKRFNSPKWTDLSDDDKQALLVTATARIDQERYSGIRNKTTQALQWPRLYMYDIDGFSIQATVIPRQLKAAVCELSYYYLEREDATMSEDDLEKFTSYEVGPLKVQTRAYVSDSLPAKVYNVLRSIGYGVLASGPGTNNRTFAR